MSGRTFSFALLVLLSFAAASAWAESAPSFLLKWGTPGVGNGQFDKPHALAVGPQGDVYVVDTDNHRVQVFDGNGRFLFKWGRFGTGDGQFDSPLGIAVDSRGRVHVADTGNCRIQQFDRRGTFLAKWGARGSGAGAFEGKQGRWSRLRGPGSDLGGRP